MSIREELERIRHMADPGRGGRNNMSAVVQKAQRGGGVAWPIRGTRRKHPLSDEQFRRLWVDSGGSMGAMRDACGALSERPIRERLQRLGLIAR